MANDDFRKHETANDLIDALVRAGRAKTKTAARKLMYQLIPLERHYQKNILRALKAAYPTGRWRKNAAGFGQAAGEPDLDGVLDGQFYAIEVKRPLIGQPTDLQKKAVREIIAAGGCAMAATYADEVVEAVKAFREGKTYWNCLTGGKAAICREEDT